MKTKKAAASTAAIRNEQHSIPYSKTVLLSSLKEQIGQLLLYLQISPEADGQNHWQRFEITLWEYVDLKFSGYDRKIQKIKREVS